MSNYNNHSSAYNFELFEPKQTKAKIIKMPERTIVQKKVKQKAALKVFNMLAVCVITLSLLSVVLYSRVQINEMGDQIIAAREDLDVANTEYTRMQLELEAKTSIKNVEEYAKQNLNMYKLEQNQIEFITVPDETEVETIEQEDKNIFEKAVEGLKDLLS